MSSSLRTEWAVVYVEYIAMSSRLRTEPKGRSTLRTEPKGLQADFEGVVLVFKLKRVGSTSELRMQNKRKISVGTVTCLKVLPSQTKSIRTTH